MCRCIATILALSLYVLPAAQTQAKSGDSAVPDKKAGVPTITVTRLDISDKALNLSYEIKNDIKQDVWICETISKWGFEVYLDEDCKTLVVRRRLDVPQLILVPELPFGRYIRLGAGERRIESLWLPLPVHHRGVFSGGAPTQGVVHTDRLTLEIGYYDEDLPMMVRAVLQETRKTDMGIRLHDLALIEKDIKGPLNFNSLNEGLVRRPEQTVLPYTHQGLKGEQVTRTTVDDCRVPYVGIPQRPKLQPPDLSSCTRIEVRYEPSVLEYFFSYSSERDLLSTAEAEYLRSLKNIVVSDRALLKDFASEIDEGFPGGITSERGSAHTVCYRNGERLTSFVVFDDMAIVTEEGQLFSYSRGLSKGLGSPRIFTPQIQPFDLRVRCAANLRDLWHRMRLYQEAEKMRLKNSSSRSEPIYPKPAKWCDSIVRAYESVGMLKENVMRAHRCVAAGDAKSHYAMNPNCRPDSPPDTVLLFETKAGWNQHGGPELFTFDNHDPKGGCVLLNGGTVKFIRTKEELQQLRWK